MKRVALVAGVALCAALASLTWWYGTTRARPGATSTASDAPASDAATSTDSHRPDHAQDAHTLDEVMRTGSLRGTDIDGAVHLDADGQPIPDADLRRLFDYHLSLIGELDAAGIRAQLQRTLGARLDATRLTQVMILFDRYLAYQQALARSGIGDRPDPAERLAAARALRRSLLGEAMAKGFFAEEEALAELSLERMRIAASDLDADRKRDALRALDARAGYGARESANLAETAAVQAEALERRNLTPAQRTAERSALWGPEAAQRLAALDAQQAQWDARVRRYLQARAGIAANPRLDAAARANAIAQLRATMFDVNEQRRIASLEAIGRLDATLGPTH